jgi:tripartite-type tricarboxylate transporter receptor subunit TctC
MRRLATALLSLGLIAAAHADALAQAFPSKSVRLLIPYGAGSATDITARIIAEPLRQKWTQGIVIENKPGAFGILAIEEMARSKPDGHTLMFGNVSTNAITPFVYKSKMKIDYEKDVVTVTKIYDLFSFFLITPVSQPPVASMKDFVAYAKANTGKLRFTIPGVASYPHYDQEYLMKKESFDAQAVVAKSGGAGMLQDVLSGDAHYGFVNAATALGVIKAGQIKALAYKGPTRHPQVPDVPTMAEAGYPDVGSSNWASLLAPAQTPREVLEAIRVAFVEAIGSPQVKDAFDKQQVYADPSPSLDAAKAFHDKEVARWKKISAESKIQPQ